MKRTLLNILFCTLILSSCASQQNETIIAETAADTSETTTEMQTSTEPQTTVTAETTETTETTASPEPVSLTSEELEKIAEDNVKGYVNCIKCDDFDSDGFNEAFVIAADTANDTSAARNDGNCERVYFINRNGEFRTVKDSLIAPLFCTEDENIISLGSKKFFTFSCTAGESAPVGYIFGVNGDSFTEPDISAKSDDEYYNIFHTGTDGKVYAAKSYSPYGKEALMFDSLLEYDESTGTFEINENQGLVNAEKYAQLVINNEAVWINELEGDRDSRGSAGPNYCGFADLNNDHVPEFIVMCGNFGAHAAEGYRIYQFENDTMVPYKRDHYEYYEEEDEPDIFVWPEGRYFDSSNSKSVYPTAFYFIKDRESGETKVISADNDAVAWQKYYSLTEYIFDNGLVRKKDIATGVVTYPGDEKEEINFYEGVYDGGDNDIEITKDEFLKYYDDLFDHEKNIISNGLLQLCKANQWDADYFGVNPDECYESFSQEKKRDILISNFIEWLDFDADKRMVSYDTAYSSYIDQNDIVFPYKELMEKIGK